MECTLNISKIQRFSVDDGPGIRTTVFLKGCNLHCAWCHNPENLMKKQVLQYKDANCIHCHKCALVCKECVHEWKDGKHLIHRQYCTHCGACSQVCYSRALEQIGMNLPVSQILSQILKDKDYYDQSEGGVTFSGGDPMLQADSLTRLLKLCKEVGLHTAVDTAGNVPYSFFQKVLPYIDLFLYDIKCLDPDKHKKYTGVYNDQILKNGKRLIEDGATLWVRTPVIPGFNDKEEELSQIRDFVKNELKICHHEELPYHEYGIGKYEGIGMDYPLQWIE